MALGDMIARAAERHRAVALDLIAGSGESVEVVIPAPRTSSSGASLFADLAVSPSQPVTKGPFSCLWHETISGSPADPVGSRIIGLFPAAKSYILCNLEEALVEITDPTGQTWFDRAEYVKYRERKYEVLGTDRSGMANTSPYLLVVVLSGEVLRHA